MSDINEYIPIKTSEYLNKYELARLAGIIELQLHNNKTFIIDSPKSLYEQACDMVINKNYNIVIRRTLPGDAYEDVHLKNLYTDHLKI